jgi:hypothetical protein
VLVDESADQLDDGRAAVNGPTGRQVDEERTPSGCEKHLARPPVVEHDDRRRPGGP